MKDIFALRLYTQVARLGNFSAARVNAGYRSPKRRGSSPISRRISVRDCLLAAPV
jgi:hypothetical protein